MIHEFIQIKSVGKFRSFNKTGDLTFRDLTLIYAENGSGKTTLTSILRSLSKNDPNLIISRKSTNSEETPVVKINFFDKSNIKKYTVFNSSGWTTQVENIEIFDCFFVDENIYSGFDFNSDHRTELYKFILGSEGVKIGELILENKENKKSKRQLYDGESIRLKELCGDHNFELPFNAAWFKKIKQVEVQNIDNKIIRAKNELDQALQSEKIRSHESIIEEAKWIIDLDWSALSIELLVSLASIQSLALNDLFNDHIKELAESGITNATSWAESGLAYIFYHGTHRETHKEVNCPFCKQTIDSGHDIISAYTQKFDQHYQNHIRNLKSYLDKIDKINFDIEYIKRSNRQDKFNQVFIYWESYIQSGKAISFKNIDIVECNLHLETIKNSINDKINSPSITVSIEPINCIISINNSFNDHIDSLNSDVRLYQNDINTFKLGLKQPDIAKANLLELNLIKRRYDQDVLDCLDSLSTLNTELKALETEYTHLMLDQEREAEEFISEYGVALNSYLKTVFKTPFSLNEIVRQPPIGKATESKLHYSLHFDGHEISSKSDAILKAKHCFSEGDKSTIALAFFLAKMESYLTKGILKDKIIIFDDPLSSLDFNRRRKTIKQILHLAENAKQVIVLSHNDSLIHELHNAHNTAKQKVSFSIEEVDQSAMLVNFDIISHMKEKDNLSMSYKSLKKFLVSPNLANKDICLPNIRKALESSIKKKNFTLIENHNINLNGLIKIIEGNPKILFRGVNEREKIVNILKELDDISGPMHHGQDSQILLSLSNSPNNISLEELKGYVEETIELIDHVL